MDTKTFKISKRIISIFVFLLILCMLAGCTENSSGSKEIGTDTSEIVTESSESISENDKQIILTINETKIDVTWEDNEAVTDLKELLKENPITIETENYGSFEQVGNLPDFLSQNDSRMTTEAGDIVLYSGKSIVLFYGSNTWEYTKLGHIEHLSVEEIQTLLNTDNTTLTISLAG